MLFGDSFIEKKLPAVISFFSVMVYESGNFIFKHEHSTKIGTAIIVKARVKCLIVLQTL